MRIIYVLIGIALSCLSLTATAAGPIQLLKDLKPGFWPNDTRKILQVATTSESVVAISKRNADSSPFFDEFHLNIFNDEGNSIYDFGYSVGQHGVFYNLTEHDAAEHPFFALQDGNVIFPSALGSFEMRMIKVDPETGAFSPLTKLLHPDVVSAIWNCGDGSIGFVRQSYESKSWQICRLDPSVYDSVQVMASVPFLFPDAMYPGTAGPARVIDNVLFFSTIEDEGRHVALYRTDGTSAGTDLVYEGPSNRFGLVKALDKCFFSVGEPASVETALYLTDATTSEPALLDASFPGSFIIFDNYAQTESSSTLYWIDGYPGKIFATDGETARSLPAHDNTDVYPVAVNWVANKLYVTMRYTNYSITTLYESDGFTTPTEVHSASLPFADLFAAVETTSGIYLYAGNAIYRGTGDLTNAVIVSQDYSSERSDNPGIWRFKDRILYTRKSGSASLETDQLMMHNPADAYDPRQLTKFTKIPVSGDPGDFLKVGNRQFFTDTRKETFANESTQAYRTDGTAESTIDILAWDSQWLGASSNGAVMTYDSRFWSDSPHWYGGSVTVIQGAPPPASPQEILPSSYDPLPVKLFEDAGLVYFGKGGPMPMLYRTDGTQGGTVGTFLGTAPDTLEYPIYPIGLANNLPVVCARTTNTATITYEIWTARLSEYQSLKLGESVTPPVAGTTLPDGRLLFAANIPGSGEELMVTDGTVTGTAIFKDLVPGPVSSNPHEITRSKDMAFFVAASPSPESGTATLWLSNGSPEATLPVDSEHLNFATSSKVDLTASVPGGVYLRIQDGGSIKLIYSDGTQPGTRVVYTGAASTNPHLLAEINGIMYLTLTTPELGREVYRTKGHTGGIDLVQDFALGTESGAVMNDAAVIGNRLLFAADNHDGITGRELYYLDVMDSNVQDWELY